MSILFLYLRIFLNKTFRLATYITMACVLGQTIAFALVIAFQCTPVDSYWDTTIPGKCIHSQAFVYSAAGINILEDLIIMFLPVMELRSLKLDLRKKFALGFMFALGSLWAHTWHALTTFADINLQCMHNEYDPTQIHHLLWDIHRLDL